MAALNNKNINTKSQINKKAGLISGYIANKIDSSQEIKRYIYYKSKNPLGSKGLGYDDELKDQPDITSSLLKLFIRDGFFLDKMASEKDIHVFVHTFKAMPVSDNVISVRVAIYILTPYEYEYLADFGEKRSYSIAQKIEDLLVDMYVDFDDFMYDDLGNLKFRLIDVSNARINESDTTILHTMVLETRMINRRV